MVVRQLITSCQLEFCSYKSQATFLYQTHEMLLNFVFLLRVLGIFHFIKICSWLSFFITLFFTDVATISKTNFTVDCLRELPFTVQTSETLIVVHILCFSHRITKVFYQQRHCLLLYMFSADLCQPATSLQRWQFCHRLYKHQ